MQSYFLLRFVLLLNFFTDLLRWLVFLVNLTEALFGEFVDMKTWTGTMLSIMIKNRPIPKILFANTTTSEKNKYAPIPKTDVNKSRYRLLRAESMLSNRSSYSNIFLDLNSFFSLTRSRKSSQYRITRNILVKGHIAIAFGGEGINPLTAIKPGKIKNNGLRSAYLLCNFSENQTTLVLALISKIRSNMPTNVIDAVSVDATRA